MSFLIFLGIAIATALLALNTFDLPDDEARREIERASSSTGLPATDPVRYDPAPLADAIHRFHLARLGR